MRLRDLKDALKGKQRRVDDLEEALRFVLLACTAPTAELALENIQDKCENMLEGVDNG